MIFRNEYGTAVTVDTYGRQNHGWEEQLVATLKVKMRLEYGSETNKQTNSGGFLCLRVQYGILYFSYGLSHPHKTNTKSLLMTPSFIRGSGRLRKAEF